MIGRLSSFWGFNMAELNFEIYTVNARKDILHFVEEHIDSKVYKKIGENPNAWIEELNIINQMLVGECLVAGTGIRAPPVKDTEFRELGGNAFLYRGKEGNLRGLWIRTKKRFNSLEEKIDPLEWTHYSMGSRAYLRINQDFRDIPFERFLPENFEPISNSVNKVKGTDNRTVQNKRPILQFTVNDRGEQLGVYAKGAEILYSMYYDYAKPSYRLTHVSSVNRVTSKREFQQTLDISNLGVKVPRIIGYYGSSVEEFLFLEEVKGDSPLEYLPKFKGELIKQDAEMLAALCLAGYRKQGFSDFDDKIFNGKDLYLIDVDECMDLYFPDKPDYRKILLDPNDKKGLWEFRMFQRSIFRQVLKDAIFDYKDSLLPNIEEQKAYISTFYKRLGCKEANEKEIKELVRFDKNFLTFDHSVNLMSDSD